MQTFYRLMLVFLCTGTLLLSCKKNSVQESYTETLTPTLPDLSTQINASVEGFITNENGEPLEDAAVTAGSVSLNTDEYGYFRINNVSFAKSAGFVRVTKAGYFAGTRTFIPTTDRRSFVKLRLIPKINAGLIPSLTGGTVSLSSGATVVLPANAVVTALTNMAYTGNVHVSLAWLDPSDMATTQLTMPGDLRGVDTNGYLLGLTTYGMLAVELESDAGEALQIAPGRKASLKFPLPPTLSGAAPASIPLWYFDEQVGLWKEEALATKVGDSYEGQVSHFSWWNCDVPNSVVNFTVQLVDQSLKPLINTAITVSIENFPNSTISFYSDSTGVVVGMMPVNNTVRVKVGVQCNPEIYNSLITTTTSAVDLGTLQIDAQQYGGRFTGTVTNCNGLPVTNGYVIISGGGLGNVIEVNNGSFDFSLLICPGSPVVFTAYDREAIQQSVPQNITVQTGLNDVGVVQSCTGLPGEYISWTLDGGPATTLTEPFHRLSGWYSLTNDISPIEAYDQINNFYSFNLVVDGAPGVGTFLPSGGISLNNESFIWMSGAAINISAYGLIGQHITGSVTNAVIRSTVTGNQYDFNLQFSVQREP